MNRIHHSASSYIEQGKKMKLYWSDPSYKKNVSNKIKEAYNKMSKLQKEEMCRNISFSKKIHLDKDRLIELYSKFSKREISHILNVNIWVVKRRLRDYGIKKIKQLYKIEKIKCSFCSREVYRTISQIKYSKIHYCSLKCKYADKNVLKANSVKATLVQFNKKGLNNLELKGRNLLNLIGLILNKDFTEQTPMFNKFVVDVLIEKKKTIIQWDGTYWHSKPKRKRLDISQDVYLKKCGYSIIRITDKEIDNPITLQKLNNLLIN